jgi:hypothetical protein
MRRAAGTICAWLVTSFAPGAGARAQEVEVTAYGVAVSNSEVDSLREARGLGVALGARVERGRFRFEVRGLTASLRANYNVQPDYALHELSVTASFVWGPRLWVQAGVERHFVDPEFASQEVGLLRVGVLSETRLSSLAQIEARAEYFPLARFTGGGSVGLALGFGIGARVGRPEGRLHGVVEFSYERIDRKVNGLPSPIKFSVARLGLGARI